MKGCKAWTKITKDQCKGWDRECKHTLSCAILAQKETEVRKVKREERKQVRLNKEQA